MTHAPRTLEELRRVSDATRLFSPWGLGGRISEEDSARYIQKLVEDCEVSPRVPGDVAKAIEVAIDLHVYGLFSYQLFTIAALQAELTKELALGLRFLEFYGQQIPLERRARDGSVIETAVVECSDIFFVTERLGRRGSHSRDKGWRLAGHDRFNGQLRSLYLWARQEGVLASWLGEMWRIRSAGAWSAMLAGIPQRPPLPPRPEGFMDWPQEEQEQWFETVLRPAWELVLIEREVEGRNLAAHPTIQPTFTPITSTSAIEHVVGLVNSLWADDHGTRAD